MKLLINLSSSFLKENIKQTITWIRVRFEIRISNDKNLLLKFIMNL